MAWLLASRFVLLHSFLFVVEGVCNHFARFSVRGRGQQENPTRSYIYCCDLKLDFAQLYPRPSITDWPRPRGHGPSIPSFFYPPFNPSMYVLRWRCRDKNSDS